MVGQAVGALALAAAWVLFPARGWPAPALILAATGTGLATSAWFSLGSSFRIGPEPHDRATLVRSGIYGRVRHPMYIAAMLAVTAAAVARPSWPVIGVALLNCAWYLLKAGFEESRLLDRYPEYEAYRRRTVGLPTLGSRRKP